MAGRSSNRNTGGAKPRTASAEDGGISDSAASFVSDAKKRFGPLDVRLSVANIDSGEIVRVPYDNIHDAD